MSETPVGHEPGRVATTVAVVETHRLHADALALLLGHDARFTVVAATTLDLVRDPPSAAVVLVAVDDPRGIELAGRMSAADDTVRVVGLHSGLGPALAARSFDAEVRALVRRDEGAAPVIDALVGQLSSSALTASDNTPTVELSDRERSVLELLAAGLSASDISRRLHLSSGETVAAKRRALRKLGARTQSQAVARARRLGVLGPHR